MTETATLSPAAPARDLPSLNDALGSLQGQLERLRSATEHIEESKQAARASVEAARHVGQAAAELTRPTQTLVERLDRVDFPLRLDKLDATVSALQAGFQTLQGRLDSVERNLKDDLHSARAAASEQVKAVEKAVDASRMQLDAAQRKTEGLLAQQAARQMASEKQLRMLLFGALGGLVVLGILLFLR